MTLQPSNKPSFEVSTESATLISMFKERKEGDVLTHAELSTAIASDHQNYMTTVKARLRDDHGINIGCIHRVGYKILSDIEVLDRGDDIRARLRRSNKRRVKELKTIEPDNLPDDTQRGRYYQENAHALMMHALTESGQQKRIAAAANEIKPSPSSTLTLPQLMQMFSPALKSA